MIRRDYMCLFFNISAKYITIDTDVLHALVKSDLDGISTKDFGLHREDRWQEYFKIKNAFFTPNGRRFNCEVRTDGVGCSFNLVEWRTEPKFVQMTEAEKIERRKQKDTAKVASLPLMEHIRWIGADPGRKDMMTAVDDQKESFQQSFTLTGKQYYHESKFTDELKRTHL